MESSSIANQIFNYVIFVHFTSVTYFFSNKNYIKYLLHLLDMYLFKKKITTIFISDNCSLNNVY